MAAGVNSILIKKWFNMPGSVLQLMKGNGIEPGKDNLPELLEWLHMGVAPTELLFFSYYLSRV